MKNHVRNFHDMQLTYEDVRYCFNYSKKTGNLTFKRRFQSNNSIRNKGDIATTLATTGYLVVYVGRKQYLAHRVIYLLTTKKQPNIMDHKNQCKVDNRWKNLRNVSSAINNRNIPMSKNNTSGTTGVSWMKTRRKFRAFIWVDGKHKHLGVFNNIEDAIHTREVAVKKYDYYKNHGRKV